MEQNYFTTKRKIRQFQKDLISWFEANKRDLPWRLDQDPYKVWVSEIMLQQTRVDTVIPYFLRFIEQFPTIEALAFAKEKKVLKAWEGLGYYSRVRNLQEAVREVAEHYGGVVPNTKDEISQLKGVGPYTAGAILSIAYGVAEPAVDGNVLRVFSRLMASYEDISKQKTRKNTEKILYEVISKENPSSFNQGIMELGALICTPTSPSCTICPVQRHCEAFKRNIQHELPIKAKKAKPKRKKMAAAMMIDDQGQALIHQRPSTGLLANLWEFPNVEVSNEDKVKKELETFLESKYGVGCEVEEKILSVEHVFSHLVWDIDVFKVKIERKVETSDENIRWKTVEAMYEYPFPVSQQKIRDYCLKG